jgi:hypothetical protein
MRDHEDDDKKFTITLDDYSGSANYASTTGSYTITSNDYVYDIPSALGTVDVSSITFDDNWKPNYNGKYIDFDVLDKYPTAKTLYNQFISVYNMCEEEEKLNGE